MVSTCKVCNIELKWQKNGVDPYTNKPKWQALDAKTNQPHNHTKEEFQQVNSSSPAVGGGMDQLSTTIIETHIKPLQKRIEELERRMGAM
jgi:hypothetical protein